MNYELLSPFNYSLGYISSSTLQQSTDEQVKIKVNLNVSDVNLALLGYEKHTSPYFFFFSFLFHSPFRRLLGRMKTLKPASKKFLESGTINPKVVTKEWCVWKLGEDILKTAPESSVMKAWENHSSSRI